MCEETVVACDTVSASLSLLQKIKYQPSGLLLIDVDTDLK
jgi:hypothetical protein